MFILEPLEKTRAWSGRGSWTVDWFCLLACGKVKPSLQCGWDRSCWCCGCPDDSLTHISTLWQNGIPMSEREAVWGLY